MAAAKPSTKMYGSVSMQKPTKKMDLKKFQDTNGEQERNNYGC